MTKPFARSRLQFLSDFTTWDTGSLVYGWRPTGMQQRAIDACLESGWDAEIEPITWAAVGIYPSDNLPREGYMETSIRPALALKDAGVDVWMELTDFMAYGSDFIRNGQLDFPREYQCYPVTGTVDSHGNPLGYTCHKTEIDDYTVDGVTVKGYESLYGPLLDYWESQLGSHFIGYEYECMFDVGAQWLSERTNKKISYRCVGNPVYNIYYSLYPPMNDDSTPESPGSLETRMTQVDEISFMMFYYDDVTWQIERMNDFKAVYPDMPLGCQTGYFPDFDSIRWGSNILATTHYTPSQQKERLTIGMNIAKAATAEGQFDFFSSYLGWRDESIEPLVNEVKFFESLALAEPSTKHAWNTSSRGGIPYYAGASVCGHATPKTDTFINTGNELILLKEHVAGCRVHNITVTSTDTLTHEDYALTCLPDRGTFIGPYSLDDYGAVPTIKYDNTNLYVSVLKDTPYSGS